MATNEARRDHLVEELRKVRSSVDEMLTDIGDDGLFDVDAVYDTEPVRKKMRTALNSLGQAASILRVV